MNKPTSTIDPLTKIITNPFDRWQAMALALAMSVAGYSVLVGIPVLTSVWVESLGYSEEQVGRLAGADLGGLSLGALIAALIITKFNRRHIALIAICIAAISNCLCLYFTDYQQALVLRSFAGIGSGIFTALAIATCSANTKPERIFTMMLFMFVFTQASELWLLDKLAIEQIYLLFAGSYLIFIPLLKYLPAHPVDNTNTIDIEDEQHHHLLATVPKYVPFICLLAIFVAYINIGSYWTYIELAALEAGIAAEWISTALITASLCAIFACALTLYLGNHFGLAKTLLVALLLMAIFVLLLAINITDPMLMISLLGFNFLWVFIDVYQMSTIAKFDHSGRFTALMPGAQGLGQIVGPNIAASFLGLSWGYSSIFILCAAASVLSLLIYGGMFYFLKYKHPLLSSVI